MSDADKYREQTRKCIDCGAEFNWSAGEQESSHGLGLADPPKRCTDCRRVKKAQRDGAGQPQGGKK